MKSFQKKCNKHYYRAKLDSVFSLKRPISNVFFLKNAHSVARRTHWFHFNRGDNIIIEKVLSPWLNVPSSCTTTFHRSCICIIFSGNFLSSLPDVRLQHNPRHGHTQCNSFYSEIFNCNSIFWLTISKTPFVCICTVN